MWYPRCLCSFQCPISEHDRKFKLSTHSNKSNLYVNLSRSHQLHHQLRICRYRSDCGQRCRPQTTDRSNFPTIIHHRRYLCVFVHLTDLTPINHLRVCAGQNTLTFLLRFCTHSQSRRKTRNKTCTFRSNRPFDASQSTINYRTWHRRHSLRCDLVAAQHAPAPASHICPKRRWQNSLVYCSSVWLACTQRNVHHSAYA